MQLIWISGATSKVQKFNITPKGLMKIGSVIGVFFLLCGMGVHFIGFKVALQVRPDFARSLSGVVTFEELDALDASYKEQLVQLQEQLSKSLEKITELKTLKDRFADLATPAPVKSKFNEPSSGARGGPLKPFVFKVDANKSIDKNFSETVQSSKDLNQILTKFKNDWSQQYDWLNQLPIGIPVASQFGSMSSNYGMRVDPFTKNLAFHSGIDFQASPGTGIVASGYGTISKVGTDAVYGRYVEISHSDGFVSKYAHAQKVFVKQGEQVSKGQLIAEVGSTGRSTGPHLHYEITRNGSNLNPAQVLLMPRQNSLSTNPKSGTAVAASQ